MTPGKLMTQLKLGGYTYSHIFLRWKSMTFVNNVPCLHLFQEGVSNNGGMKGGVGAWWWWWLNFLILE